MGQNHCSRAVFSSFLLLNSKYFSVWHPPESEATVCKSLFLMGTYFQRHSMGFFKALVKMGTKVTALECFWKLNTLNSWKNLRTKFLTCSWKMYVESFFLVPDTFLFIFQGKARTQSHTAFLIPFSLCFLHVSTCSPMEENLNTTPFTVVELLCHIVHL